MKRRSKFAVVLLCLALAAGTLLSGCGGAGGGARVELPDYTPLYRYHEPVVLSVGQYTTGDYPKGQGPGNNVIYDLFEEVMNIKLTAQFSTTWGQAYHDKITNAIQSSTLPDVFQVFPYQLYQLIKFDMVWDLTDLFEQYASDEVKHMLKYNNVDMADNTATTTENMLINSVSKNGRMFGLPWVTSKSNGVPLMYIRKDLREKIGAEVPKTADEVFALAERFTKEFSTPAKPFYGLDFSTTPKAPYHMYGAYPEMYIKGEDGKYAYGSYDDKVLTVTEKLNALFQKGAINQDYGVTSTTVDLIASGQVGIAFAEFWSCMGGMQSLMQSDPTVEWEVYQIPSETEGVEALPGTIPNIQGCFVVSKECKNPEAAIVMYNHLVDQYFSDNGVYTKRYTEIKNSAEYAEFKDMANWAPMRTDGPTVKKERENAIIEAVEAGSDATLTYQEKVDYENIRQYTEHKNKNFWWYYFTYTKTLPCVRSYASVKVTDYQELGTPSMMSQAGFIADRETDFFVKGIRGSYDKEISKDLAGWFAYFKSEQMKVGMRDVLNELNAL